MNKNKKRSQSLTQKFLPSLCLSDIAALPSFLPLSLPSSFSPHFLPSSSPFSLFLPPLLPALHEMYPSLVGISRKAVYKKSVPLNRVLHFLFMYIPEKEMATHSSILAWRIPWTEEPGWLQSMRSQRLGHS